MLGQPPRLSEASAERLGFHLSSLTLKGGAGLLLAGPGAAVRAYGSNSKTL
jgi:hypothetical protein